ncbi:MAG: hypothetical protein J6A89_06720 [Clostridia bacterium]|nr:hypothetical protein [Clostridia bacterium]
MKTIKNIILVILFGTFVSFCLYIAPNYKKDGTENVTNLVINYTNVTSKKKGEVIIEDDGTIYISKQDIENYYDKYLYYDEQYNYIIAASNGKTACFHIDDEILDINGNKSNSKIIKKNDTYYIPISKIEEVYNINVKYIEKNNTVVIESLDRKLQTAKTTKSTNVKYKNTEFSKSLEKLDEGSKVSIVPNEEIINYEGWTLVKTENGKIGYIKNENLTESIIEREEPVKENKTISLVWEYFSEYAKAPENDENVKYNGVNVVSPSFFYIQDSKLKENVGTEGVNYINWAKANNYEVWPMVANNSDNKEKMDEFSEWIRDYKKRQNMINQIVNYVKKYNLDGINIDFENIYLKDKDYLSRFIIELKPKLEAVNAKLSVDVTEPDGSENWSLCFDRNLIGDVADYIVFMAYDQHGKSSEVAGSTAAYYWVERNINKFINQEEVDPSKIILGIPFYTILWKQSDNELKGDFVATKNVDKYITSDLEVQWLEDSKQNYIEYNKNNVTYKMWIEDEQSISEKLNLVNKYNLAGAAFWQKGYEDESIWTIVKQKLME